MNRMYGKQLRFGLTYSVVQDNQFRTWRVYDSHYWPAKYLIGKDGNIRYTHFGEGEYDETEKMIQELLYETGSGKISGDVNNAVQVQNFARTPESYLGYTRIERLSSPEAISKDRISLYTAPKLLPLSVLVDGVSGYFGADVHDGIAMVDFDRLYKLVSLPSAGQHTMTLEFIDDLELLAFTFG